MPESVSITSENTRRIKDFTTTILRKIRKIEYSNVSLIPGYERTEKEYLSLRNNLNDANVLVKDLMSYEHGNRFIKAIKNGLQHLNDKASLTLYKNKDVFESLSSLSKNMGIMSINDEDKKTAERFSCAYRKISDSKKQMNSRLENIRLQLKEKRMQCLDLNKERKKVKNMRFDLEILLQDKGYNGEIREVEKKEFFNYSSKVLKSMIHFLEDNSQLSRILKEVSKEHARHLKESSDALKEIE